MLLSSCSRQQSGLSEIKGEEMIIKDILMLMSHPCLIC